MRLEETKTYKTCSVLCHLLTIFLLGTNVLLLFFKFYFRKFILIEELLDLGYVSLSFFYFTTAIINIIITLFAAFGIHAKIKPYMSLYVTLACINLAYMLAVVIYLLIFYGDSFNSAYSAQSSSSLKVSLLIKSTFQCQPAGKVTCDDIIQSVLRRSFFIYIFLTGMSILITTINIILIKIALTNKIEDYTQKNPEVKECDKVGLQSSSLRIKRPIPETDMKDIETKTIEFYYSDQQSV
ncbi:hypothetical protein H312_01528 [Anncaliia algerae PRA339]|uniref:MARVEL domain-containing protein n=1 Tax=Anncaliia algerae PRA339 TaxID=1288291 RepID=A0A059F1U5_9MICR|nr:hypothetical protein H312_01528 [Anncaliia algerae PRA339]